MELSQEQGFAAKQVDDWLKDPFGKQVFRLFGYAGVGKTSVAIHLASMVKGGVCFAAFTGKAALVMRAKGCAGASTIHSLIYNPVQNEWGGTEFVLNPGSAVLDCKLVIIDEASMVDEGLGRDLLSFGTRVLVLGDPAQLPPVRGQGFFTHGADCEPDVMLTEVHRQAAESPIIQMATAVRNGERLVHGVYGSSKIITHADFKENHAGEVLAADQIIVGRNITRHLWNARIRTLKKLNPNRPVKGEKLVCLKNFRKKGLLNGGLWTAEKVSKSKGSFSMWVQPIDTPPLEKATNVKVRSEFFTGDEDEIPKEDRRYSDEFTYAYALTCHKCQGSQFDSTLIYDESGVFREDAKKWLYTAVTRAADKLTLVMN